MIRAVFFDLYNTLVHHEPLPEQQQSRACRDLGIAVGEDDLRRGFWAASDFFSRENARLPVERRSESEKSRLWVDYEITLLREAGVEATPRLAGQILEKVSGMVRRVVLFDDVQPALVALRRRGLLLGLISNLDRSLEQFCDEVGLDSYLDFMTLSHEVGVDKPHPGIFQAALERAQVAPSEAIHVGDQYASDVVGSLAVGIRPLLLDRDGHSQEHPDCQRISSLTEVEQHI